MTTRPSRARRNYPARRAGRVRRYSRADVVIVTVGLAVAIALDLGLVWGPALASVVLSATDWNGIGAIHWIGAGNYHDLAAEYPPFWPAVRHNLLWLGFLALVATPFGLLCAVLLDRRLRLARVYRNALYAPVVLSLAVVGFIAQLVFSRDYGVVNTATGLTTDWLGDPAINIWVVLIFAGWRHVGYVMILYLAGLKSVDPQLKEAAAIDGAGEAQTFRRVVFPALRPINIIVLVITVIEALRAFDAVYAVNKGRNGLELLSVLVFENIVGEAGRIGFGSAIAVVLLVISLGCIVTYLVQVFRQEGGER